MELLKIILLSFILPTTLMPMHADGSMQRDIRNDEQLTLLQKLRELKTELTSFTLSDVQMQQVKEEISQLEVLLVHTLA